MVTWGLVKIMIPLVHCLCALTELKLGNTPFLAHVYPSLTREQADSEFLRRGVCAGAFFDMYLGEVPVSEQTKEEIGRNIATVIKRC